MPFGGGPPQQLPQQPSAASGVGTFGGLLPPQQAQGLPGPEGVTKPAWILLTKTRMCKYFSKGGVCPYATKCR